MRLLDTHGRLIKDVRISVTPRCNLHCLYCHPLGLEMAEPPGTLTVEDVDHFLEAASLLGLSAVRFTGGEPLVRKELPQMIERARSKEGIEDVAITTNGLLFARRAKELVQAGLNRVNISLDAITPEVFTRITRGGKVERVLEAVETALELGLHPVKMNAVVIRGMNEEEVVPLARLSVDRPLHMRFIEYMHLDNSDPEEYRRRFVPGSETWARIEAVFGPLEPVPHDPSSPARVYRIPGAKGTVGFINPVTEPFCSHCSRLRLTSDKKLRPCLLTDLEMDIAWAFAAENPVEALVDAILIATQRKPAFGNTLPTLRKRVMLGIGG
ncbi:molybdenum cofactor biosynthesis protein A [Thermus oshimai JL-2]|uniref:Molybdenum cofactor biosynthesis protein A n=1 Tax=Thermus oshimai JL-2 TaxID=751945 RepID=K7RKG4_THEOS|nr:GTP 3',8-cyclase MoaA [Thermus oshimai]AFV76902.1 molybdenum cofactor biosynthesis protein A [Thermus oshimai JL-2]